MASQSGARPDTTRGTAQRTFLGHPVGLYVLFFTEMWERFSYYGMRALLILYMVNYYRWAQEDASKVYKWYTGLVYLTPLLGGYLADRYLGNKRAVLIGAVLMAIGQFMLVFESYTIFYAALIFLIFGNGFFKPNMSTQVGRLYPPNDVRRDGAYTIFYMGINLGAFFSPLVCGWLAENTVWKYHAGFAAAGIGMVFGLVIYLVGTRWVIEVDAESKPEAFKTAFVEEKLPAGFIAALRELQVRSKTAAGGAAVQVLIKEIPAGFDFRKAGYKESEITYDAASQMLTTRIPLQDEDIHRLMVAAGNPPSTPVGGPAAAAGEEAGLEVRPRGNSEDPISEEIAERTPSRMPLLNRLSPLFLVVAGCALAVVAPLLGFLQWVAWDNVVALEIAAGCSMIGAWILSQVHLAVRDRVLAIFALGVFVVFFWAAFEQAGNVLNLWADKSTDRSLSTDAEAPPIYPKTDEEAAAEKTGRGIWGWWVDLWNPVPTAWFQSINALAIFLLAPVFAYLWTALGRRGLNPSIPTKMAIGVLFVGFAFAVMIGAARREDQPSRFHLESLPEGIYLNDGDQICLMPPDSDERVPFFGGRLTYNPQTHTLRVRGALPDIDRERLVGETAPKSFVKKIDKLQAETKGLKEGQEKQVRLDPVPPGFDMKYAGFKKKDVSYNPDNHVLTARIALADKDIKALKMAAGEPAFRKVIDKVYQETSRFRVSAWWLFWAYILMTLGELCLSPVGLSMVSKLAPAKFATMLMGLWLLTSFFGNFAAGAFGEKWGTWAPTPYFLFFTVVLAGASMVLFFLVRKIVSMMHGVN
jgi:dipeptide/tripeptide permease